MRGKKDLFIFFCIFIKNKLLGYVHTKSDVATQAGRVVERLCGREVKLQSSPVVRCVELASDRREMGGR